MNFLKNATTEICMYLVYSYTEEVINLGYGLVDA